MYEATHQFEPLLPTLAHPELEALAEKLSARALELKGLVHPATGARIADLLRGVNAYYSNRIEGQHTHPREIERALRKDFDKSPEKARLQRLAIAHIDTQKEMESWLAAEPALSVYAPDFIARLHASFYGRLPAAERVAEQGDAIIPGAWRRKNVEVGAHIAPVWQAVPHFLDRVEQVYAAQKGASRQLIALACAHHRLAWVHPFRDGNGRVMRLQSQAALLRQGAGSGLWAVSRGLARSVKTYYARLADADQPREGDLDGRGNLSEKGLAAFAKYFLDTCLDQVTFMSELLQLKDLRPRMRAYLKLLAEAEGDIRVEAEPALYHVFLAGSVRRGEFKQMTGLGARVADKAIAAMLKKELLVSDTPKGPVSIGLPLDALAFYFPRLYPEAAA
ncbi:MAG: Fic family protein [Burkholderiales bacterium]|nr:Fic family protein [Burkholderiales bacterium]